MEIKKSRGRFVYGFLAALLPFFLTGFVYACSYAIDPNNPNFDPDAERNYYGQYFFFATWALLLLNVGFLFFSCRKYLGGVVVLVLIIPIQFAALVVSMLMGSCGDAYHQLIRYESGILFIILLVQLSDFIYRRRRAKNQ